MKTALILLFGSLYAARINLSVVDGETITMFATDPVDTPTDNLTAATPAVAAPASDMLLGDLEKPNPTTSSAPLPQPDPTTTGSTTASSSPCPFPGKSVNGTYIPGLCPLDQKDPRLELGKSTWWHCEGSAIACFSQLMNDTHTNLLNPNCTNANCFTPHVPTNIQVLAALADKYWPKERDAAGTRPESTTLGFTPFMELLANVIVQKSRWCRIDMDAVAHLSQLVASSQPCCGNSTITTAASNSTRTVNIWTSALTKVQTFTSAWTVTG